MKKVNFKQATYMLLLFSGSQRIYAKEEISIERLDRQEVQRNNTLYTNKNYIRIDDVTLTLKVFKFIELGMVLLLFRPL